MSTKTKAATNVIMTGLKNVVIRGGLKLEEALASEAEKELIKDAFEKYKEATGKTKQKTDKPKNSPKDSSKDSDSAPVPEEKKPDPLKPEPPRPRTKEDEEIYVHTARLKEEPPIPRRHSSRRSRSGVSIKTLPKDHHVYTQLPQELPGDMAPASHIPPAGEMPQATPTSEKPHTTVVFELSAVDDLLERLNLQSAIAMAKNASVTITELLLRTGYVSTDSLGKLHLQSFAGGIGVSILAAFLYPYISEYVDRWFGMFGTLFRHLGVWLIAGIVLSYVMNPKHKTSTQSAPNTPADQTFNHKYTELQYSVKSSEPTRNASPTRSPRMAQQPLYSRRLLPRRETEPSLPQVRRNSGMTDAQMLVSMTEHQQFLERARLDAPILEKPKDGYEKFMSGAMREEGKREKYAAFVDEAGRKETEREKYAKFVGATREQIMKKRG